MKRLLLLVLCLAFILPGYAQDRRSERKARREQHRALRVVQDSLRLMMEDEDSVNIGYGYVKKKNLISSVSKVSVNKNDIGSYTNIGEYLRGRVPGLHVIGNGGSYKYMVRGINSINSSTDPLFVVDGVVVMDIDFLNPQDVKSVEVIKDGSASIYGARGACGVILITTHKMHED